MNFKRSGEPNIQSWGWRMLLGPAMMVDGLLHFFTAGCFSAGLALACARQLAWRRGKPVRKNRGWRRFF